METLTVRFADSDDEVVLSTSPVSIDGYFGVREALDNGTWGDRATIDAIVSGLAPYVVSWADPASDIHRLISVAKEWVEEVRSVPRPLPLRSSGGEPSPEPSQSPSD